MFVLTMYVCVRVRNHMEPGLSHVVGLNCHGISARLRR